MFQLSDKTRRPVCVAIFFLACVLPTLCIFAWGVSRNVPWHAAGEARRLGEQLGLEVSLDAVRHPRPGVVVYENLELSNPETGAIMLRCGRLRAEWTLFDETVESRLPCLVLIAERTKIDAAEKDSLWPFVQRMLAREVGLPGNLRLAADRVEVRCEDETSGSANAERSQGDSQVTAGSAHALLNVEGKIDTFDQWMQAELAFHTALSNGPEPAEPTRIRVQRIRQAGKPFTRFDLDTGGQANDQPDTAAPALPCSLLGLAFEPFAGLGPESQFRGSVQTSLTPNGHDLLRGEFLNIDLGQVAAGLLQDQIRGKANLTVHLAQFHQGKPLNVNAEIDTHDGVISGALLRRAIERLGLRQWDNPYPLPPEEAVRFKQIAASFVLDVNGLQSLQGKCASREPNTVMTVKFAPFLLAPQPGSIIPPEDVIRMLAPESATSTASLGVPVTYETAWLMGRLPMPRLQ